MLISAPGFLRPKPDGWIVPFPWETEVCTRDTQGDHLQLLYSRHCQRLSLAWVLQLSLNSFSFNFQKWNLWWWPSSSNSRRSRFVRLVLLSLVRAASCWLVRWSIRNNQGIYCAGSCANLVAAPDSCQDDPDRLKQSRQALLSLDNWLLIRHTCPKAAQGGFDVDVFEQYFPDTILYRLMAFCNSPKEEQIWNMYTFNLHLKYFRQKSLFHTS